MFGFENDDVTTFQLICCLCAYTIDNQKIINSYRSNSILAVKHCVNCLTLQPPKRNTIKKRFKIFIKYPDIMQFIYRKFLSEEKCKKCGSEYFVAWNGLCPKCGEPLYLKLK